MRTILAALAAMLALHAQAVRLTEDGDSTLVRITQESDDADADGESAALVEAALPLIECVLKNEDEETVCAIVSDVLDSVNDDEDDDEDDEDEDDDTDSDDE